MYVWRACFFRFTLPAAFEFFSLAASCQGLHTPACTHTHTGTAHFDPSPLMDHRTHVLLIFLPIPGPQWHVGKSCAYEAKTISCQCCFIFGQKLAENFSDTGPLIHMHLYRGEYSDTHTHTHMGQGKQSHRHKTMLPNCRKYETTRHQHSLITIGCDRDRNIIFDILDIHMYTYACALCEVFPFLFADFFTWRQNVNKSCRYR